jgi:hypothetical protein
MHRGDVKENVMALIEEFGFTVSEGREEEFQEWLRQHEEELRQAHPPGVRYLGTYGVVFSSEKQAGSYRLLLELDSYATIDTLAEAMKDAESDFGRLVREHSSFSAFDPTLPWSQSLYRSLVDMAVFDLRPSPTT